MDDQMNLDLLLPPVPLPTADLPMLSSTKLGIVHSTSVSLSRKLESKGIAKNFEFFLPWQQKLFVKTLIDRCQGPDLKKLNNILEPLKHRGFQASFNHHYPVEGFRNRINPKKVEIKIKKMFDKIFMVKMNWKRAGKRNKRRRLRKMYLQEQWCPSVPTYHCADTRQFTHHIQEAVAKILREHGYPVMASYEASHEPGAIKPKKGKRNINLPEQLAATPKLFSPPPRLQKMSIRSECKKHSKTETFFGYTDIKNDSIEERNNINIRASPRTSRDAGVGQLSKPPSQKALNLDRDQHPRIINRSPQNSRLLILPEDENEDPVPVEDAVRVLSERLATPSASAHYATEFIDPPTPSQTPVYEPRQANTYHMKHPSILRAFRPESDGVLSNLSVSTAQGHTSQQRMHTTSTPNLSDTQTPLTDQRQTSAPQLNMSSPRNVKHSYQSATGLAGSPIYEERESVVSDTMVAVETGALISNVTEVATGLSPRSNTSSGGLTKSMDVVNRPASPINISVDTAQMAPNADKAAESGSRSVIGLLLVNKKPSVLGKPSQELRDPSSMLSAKERLRIKANSAIDACETSLPSFDVVPPEKQDPVENEVLEVIEPEYSEYSPTEEEKEEDNSLIKEFVDSLHRSLDDSKDLINNEDDLADEIAECILSSAVGLALVSTDLDSKLSKGRLFNLKDRMSSEALQATIKVFRINPPITAPKDGHRESKGNMQNVPPFTFPKESLMQKIGLPETYFPKKPKPVIPQLSTPKKVSGAKTPTSSAMTLKQKLKMKKKKKKMIPDLSVMPDKYLPIFPYDEESQVPNPNEMEQKKFCKTSRHLPDKLARAFTPCSTDETLASSRGAVVEDFKLQLEHINLITADWKASEILSLLAELIVLSHTASPSVLPMIKAEIGRKATHIQNITELPDRVMLKLFSYLDVRSISCCQEVCRRWRFLCSQPRIWRGKCEKLGAKYDIVDLCGQLFEDMAGRRVDWEMVYWEVEAILKRTFEPSSQVLHPAVLAKKDCTSQIDLIGLNSCKLPRLIASDTETKDRKGSEENLSTPTSTIIVSDFTHSAKSSESNIDSLRTPVEPIPQSIAMKSKRTFHNSKFPPLKLADEKLIWVTDSPMKGDPDERKSENLPRIDNSCDTFGSWSQDPQVVTKVEPKSRRVSIVVPSDTSDVAEAPKPEEQFNGVALDIRTDLRQAVELTDMKGMDNSSNVLQRSMGNSSGILQRSMDLASYYSAQKYSTVSSTSTAAAHGETLLEWLPASEYNLRDTNISRRIIGYVKPVNYVHKFRGHPDEIYCCAFDRNRVFTGGIDSYICLWDIRTGRLVEELSAHTGSVRCLELDSDDDILYSASWDMSIIVWDVIKFRVKACLTGHTAAVVGVKLCKRQHIICSASTDGTVRTWSTDTYAGIQVFRDHCSYINCLYYDGVDIASGGADRQVHLYSYKMSSSEYEHRGQCDAGNTLKSTFSIARLALRTGQSWNKADQDKYKANNVMAILVINDLVVGGTCHGEIICWSKLTMSTLAKFDHHIGAITSIHLWCSRLLTSGSDGVIKETDLATMTCVRRLHDHASAIHCTKVDQKLERIVSVGKDKLIHVWHFATDKKRPKVEASGTIKSVSTPSYALEMESHQTS